MWCLSFLLAVGPLQNYAQIWQDRVSPFVVESTSPAERQRQIAIVEMLETWRTLTRELETFVRVRTHSQAP
jgi:hypothetical protein